MLVPAVVMATVYVPVNHGIPIAHDNLRRRRNGACKHCRHGRSYNDQRRAASSSLRLPCSSRGFRHGWTRPTCRRRPGRRQSRCGDRHVTAADRCALWRRAYPGSGNLQAARGDVLSLCRPCHENGKRGDESKTSHDELRDEGHCWTCPARRVCVNCDGRPASQAGGARAICGPLEAAVAGAAIGKVCTQVAPCNSRAMTAGIPARECDREQTPHPMTHASPAPRLPGS
jgi:hypothetical protein